MPRFLIVLLGLAVAATANAATPAPALAPAATAAAPTPAAPLGRVTRAVFTSAVVDHEPKDDLTQVPASANRIYYFTDLHGLQGQTVVHRWEYNGKVVAEVKFNVGGPRWRVFSVKTLNPSHTGQWKVSTVDAHGNVLSVNTFTYGGAAVTPTSTPAKSSS